MIFSEIYSVYYNTVARIITRILEGEASEKELKRIITECAFGESALTVLPSLKSGQWQLMHSDMTTPLEHIPSMPPTTLEKRWLKAISLDPRIKLFGVEIPGIEDVEPLFTEDDYYIYDKYTDSDPFTDKGYIGRFRFILSAIREGKPIKINMTNKNGKNVYSKLIPKRLEYSEKDDKFRLITSGCRFMPTVNLSKITSAARYNGEDIKEKVREERCETVTLEINDERNALERVMLHFAHFEKQAQRIDKNRYLVSIKYSYNDEVEMVIRVLSFGPLVKVIEPERFVGLMREKLRRQMNCKMR